MGLLGDQNKWGNRGFKRSFGEVMNYFAPVIGKNGMTSNQYMNGYFLQQEALRGCGNSQVSYVSWFCPFLNIILFETSAQFTFC